MNRNKHTSGPWSYGGDWDEYGAVANCGDSVEYVYTLRPHLVNRKFSNIPPAEQEANARLVAAAPELLDACRMLVAWDEHGGDAPEMLKDAVETARLAMGKMDCGR